MSQFVLPSFTNSDLSSFPENLSYLLLLEHFEHTAHHWWAREQRISCNIRICATEWEVEILRVILELPQYIRI